MNFTKITAIYTMMYAIISLVLLRSLKIKRALSELQIS